MLGRQQFCLTAADQINHAPVWRLWGGLTVSIRKLGIGGFVTVLWVMVLGALALPALAAVEAPEGEAVSAVTATTAHVSGVLNPKEASGEVAPGFYGFLYGVAEPPACGEERLVPEPFGEAGPAAGLPKEAVSSDLTGLQPHAKYTFCLIEENTEHAEETFGAPVPFETRPAAPTVNPPAATVATPFEARLESVVNPNNETTSCEFEYGRTVVTEKKVQCEQASLGGYGEQGVGAPVTGLTGGETYDYRIVATNATGATTVEAASTFTTLPAEKPGVGGEEISGLSSSEATVDVKINPDFQETACEVRFWRAEELESTATKVPCDPTGAALGLGSEAVAVTALLEPLTPGETYDYRVLASNGTGDYSGPVRPFQALHVPVLTTEGAQGVTAITATIAGTVNSYGAGTVYHVVYASEAQYRLGCGPCDSAPGEPYAQGAFSPNLFAAAGYAPVPAGPFVLENLAPGTTYHYALIASNREGTVIGPDQTFTTAAAEPSPPAPATSETGPAPVASPFVLPGAFPFVPYTPVAAVQAKEAKEASTTTITTTTSTKPLTNAQQRAKALKACRRDRSKTKRSKCERQANRKAKR
jgi:hypothetical protein